VEGSVLEADQESGLVWNKFYAQNNELPEKRRGTPKREKAPSFVSLFSPGNGHDRVEGPVLVADHESRLD
jgi:hypothetical protein